MLGLVTVLQLDIELEIKQKYESRCCITCRWKQCEDEIASCQAIPRSLWASSSGIYNRLFS